MRPHKPAASVLRAKRLRRALTKPEVMLWQILRTAPGGHKFRKQHPSGPYVLDFFCARANLAIEIDGMAHDTGDNPVRDARRDACLAEHRIDTIRIAAIDVLRDPLEVASEVVAMIDDRLSLFGKDPPTLRATSPMQVIGEDKDALAALSSPSTCDGEVAGQGPEERASPSMRKDSAT